MRKAPSGWRGDEARQESKAGRTLDGKFTTAHFQVGRRERQAYPSCPGASAQEAATELRGEYLRAAVGEPGFRKKSDS
jgi:hypothetical protein